MADPSVKRRLAARVAEATGVPVEKVDLVIRALCEEMLRAAHERIGDRGDNLRIPGVGRFWTSASRRGCRHPRTGRELDPHRAFWFRPSKIMADRCAAIRAERGI